MAVLNERASKGNAKAIENLCLGDRGFVLWLISQLKGDYDPETEKSVWQKFIQSVREGAVSVGENIERTLIGCAVAAVSGNDSFGSQITNDEGILKTIKFPGDLDAAKGYLTDIFNKVPAAQKALLLLAIAGFSLKSAASAVGMNETDAASIVNDSLDLFRESVKTAAKGRYNINIPSPEMALDVLTRASGSFKAEEEIDDSIRSLISGGFAPKEKETAPADEKGSSKSSILKYAVALFCVALVVIGGILFFKGKGNEGDGGTGTYDGPTEDDGDDTENLNVVYNVVMKIKDYGTIELVLDYKSAPRTVKNFVDLAKSGFYDGLTFHRIMDGFMIQGGDPEGNGTGGSKKKIIGEFSANGVENPISHTRGTISMARASGDYNSARSQFFICQVDCSSSLDGQYAAFGHVTSGMEIVDQICKDARPTDNNGTIPKDQQPVIESVTVTAEYSEDSE